MEYGSSVSWRQSRSDTLLSGRWVGLAGGRQRSCLPVRRPVGSRSATGGWGEPWRFGVSRARRFPHQKGAVLEAGALAGKLEEKVCIAYGRRVLNCGSDAEHLCLMVMGAVEKLNLEAGCPGGVSRRNTLLPAGDLASGGRGASFAPLPEGCGMAGNGIRRLCVMEAEPE